MTESKHDEKSTSSERGEWAIGWIAVGVVIMAVITVAFFIYPYPNNKPVGFWDYVQFFNKDLYFFVLGLICLLMWLIHKIRR